MVVVLLTIGVDVGVILLHVGRLAPGCMLRNAENEDAAERLSKVIDVVQGDLRLVGIPLLFKGPCRENKGNDDPEHHRHCESDRPANQVLTQSYVSM